MTSCEGMDALEMNHCLNRKLAYENCKEHFMFQDILYFKMSNCVETVAKAQFSQEFLFYVID